MVGGSEVAREREFWQVVTCLTRSSTFIINVILCCKLKTKGRNGWVMREKAVLKKGGPNFKLWKRTASGQERRRYIA